MNSMALPPQRSAAGSPVTPVLRAVLLADLADSTAFVQHHGDARAAGALQRLDLQIRDLLEFTGGRLIDIDKFKVLNDLSGHLVGDAVLRAVADEVRAAAGPLELPCRLGGDEFALLLRVADEGDLANRALGLIAGIRGLRLPSLRERGLSISVGGVFCSDPGGWSSWYSQGDLALYEAKSRGGDRWRLAL